MARRSVRLTRTRACGAHLLYRSEYEATVRAAWHVGAVCTKCRAGRAWHIWQCPGQKHWHCGHASLRAMSPAP